MFIIFSLIDVRFLRRLNYPSLKRKLTKKDLSLLPRLWLFSPTTAGTGITRIALNYPNAHSEIAISRSNCPQLLFNLPLQRTMITSLTSKVYVSAMHNFTNSFAMKRLLANILIR